MKRILVLSLLVYAAGGGFAQETFSQADAGGFFGVGPIDFYTMPDAGRLDLLQAETGKAPLGGSPLNAGLMNIPLGLWSWLNQDWTGGAITAGLMAGGLFLFFTLPIIGLLPGLGLMIASPIYGFFRGQSYYKKLSGNIAFGGNPLEHISPVFLPASDGKGAPGLCYQANF